MCKTRGVQYVSSLLIKFAAGLFAQYALVCMATGHLQDSYLNVKFRAIAKYPADGEKNGNDLIPTLRFHYISRKTVRTVAVTNLNTV